MEEIFLVQLFSSPQQTAASSTNSDPREKRKLSAPSKERRTLEIVIKPIAPQSRFVTVSLKMKRAINVVATISKLPRREALEELP